MTLREVLERLSDGRMSLSEAEEYLGSWGVASVGFHKLDVHRGRRTAVPEVIFGMSKSATELADIAKELLDRGLPLLVTRVEPHKALHLLTNFPSLVYDERARIVRSGDSTQRVSGHVAVVSAGSSDAPVAEEAAATLEFFGAKVTRVYDCGVAGLHRLFASGEELAAVDVAIVVAGMDGALPSVVGGLFRHPLIAVPTSVGYGASFQGLAALLTMLNSCAPGLTVVNIDNGFGAAAAAVSILKLAERKTAERSEDRLREDGG